jgi:hypothetical protein
MRCPGLGSVLGRIQAPAAPSGPAASRQAGPSMSTGPGWTAALARVPSYLGRKRVRWPWSSMLLSFERPASAPRRRPPLTGGVVGSEPALCASPGP